MGLMMCQRQMSPDALVGAQTNEAVLVASAPLHESVVPSLVSNAWVELASRGLWICGLQMDLEV